MIDTKSTAELFYPVSNRMVLKFRWSDSEPDDPSRPLAWQIPALITATLFLNFAFWTYHNLVLWAPGSTLRNAGILLAASILMTALFFVGPALAAQAARRPILSVAEDSLGSAPTIVLRLCCVFFLMIWLATLVAGPVLPRLLWQVIEQPGWVAGAILVFAFVTGLQTLVTRAKLASFTNKLGMAILVAAFFRVRDGWPATLKGFPVYDTSSVISDEWHGLAILSFYVAPLAFFAADFGHRSPGRKQVAAIATFGLVLPLCGTLFAVGVIDVTTRASQAYQPSLEPSVAMALGRRVSHTSIAGGMLAAAITTFGAIRFGAAALSDSTSVFAVGQRMRWAMLGCFIVAIAWLSTREPYSMVPFDLAGTGITAAGAVITADFAAAKWRIPRAKRIDWIGTTALLAGWMAAFYLPKGIVGTEPDQWWHPWLLPSYGVAFLVCLSGRALHRLLSERRTN